MQKKGNMHHIATLGYGYWVRFYRGSSIPDQGKKSELYLHKTFKFDDFGGKRAALKAARAWRDEQLPGHQAKYISGGAKKRGRAHRLPRFDNSTDTVGVGRIERPKENGGLYIAYFARWNQEFPDGKTRTRTKNYRVTEDRDEKKAFDLAKRHRKRMERRHYKR